MKLGDAEYNKIIQDLIDRHKASQKQQHSIFVDEIEGKMLAEMLAESEKQEVPKGYWKASGRKNYIRIKDMQTSHIANALWVACGKKDCIFSHRYDQILELIEEFELRTDIQPQDFNKYANSIANLEDDKYMSQTYNIRITSPFILTQKQVKEKLGIGYKVLEVQAEKDVQVVKIDSVDTAMENIILAGYRALARAYHPDLGGDPEVMIILNRTKKELLDLLKDLKG